LGLAFSGGNAISGGVFALFGPPLSGPGPQLIAPVFWLKVCLETRPKSALNNDEIRQKYPFFRKGLNDLEAE